MSSRINSASQWRRAVAKRLGSIYAANPHVAAVLLGGSTARGHADKFSDIEIGVFWHQPPANAERQAGVNQAGADLIRLYPYDRVEEAWSDSFMVGRAPTGGPKSGVLVEVVHYTAAFVERTLEEVLTEYDPGEQKLNLIAAIVDGLALSGSELISHWQALATPYPAGLAAAVVAHYGVIDHFWRWEMWLDRDRNLMMLYRSFFEVEHRLLHLLLGLNRVYYFGFKWLNVVVARLPIAPADLGRRLIDVYEVPPAEGAQALARLVEESFDLVELNLPQVNVAWLREVFRYRRPEWEMLPPQ